MKTMGKRLSDLSRLCLCLVVALTLAMPYAGNKNAFANESSSGTSGNTIDLVAFRADTRASSLSLDEAKANLDSANQIKAEAAANKEDAQNALTAAEASYKEADSAHQSAVNEASGANDRASQAIDAAVIKTQQEYSAAQDAYKEAEEAYNKASEAEGKARDSLREATTAYNEAKSNYDNAIAGSGDSRLQTAAAQLEQAKQALLQAEKESERLGSVRDTLENERDAALAAWKAAGTKVEAAQKAADAATAAVTNANAQLEAAKTALSNAPEDQTEALRAKVTTAQNKVAEAQGQKTEAEGRLATAQNEKSAAQSALDTANATLRDALAAAGGNVTELQAAVDEAQKAYDKALQTYQEQARDAGATNEAGEVVGYQDAQNALDAAQLAYENAQKKTQDAKKDWDDAKDRLAAITGGGTENPGSATSTQLSLKDFFENQGSTDASSLFDNSELATGTNLGSSGDATDVGDGSSSNVDVAISIIESLNTWRANNAEELDLTLGELRVTDDLMALAALAANYYSLNSGHADAYGTTIRVDNITSTPGDALITVLNDEKTIWSDAKANNSWNGEALNEGWADLSAADLKVQHPAFYAAIENFLNAIDATYMYVGAGYNTADNTYSSDAALTLSASAASDTYTPNDWKTRFDSWRSNAQQPVTPTPSEEDIQAAQNEVNRLEGVYNNCVTAEGTAEDARDSAQDVLDAATSVKSYEDEKNTKAQALQEAKDARDNASSSTVDPNDETHPVNIARKAVADAQSRLTTAGATETEILSKIAGYEKTITDETAKAEQAQRDLEAYVAPDNSRYEQAVADAEKKLEDAQEAERLANEELQTCGTERSDAYETYEQKNDAYRGAVTAKNNYDSGELQQKQNEYDDADTEYRNAGGYAPEIASYKRTADQKYNAMTAQENTVSKLEKETGEKMNLWIDATTREDMAKIKLDKVEAAAKLKDEQSVEASLNALTALSDYEEFTAMNTHLETIKTHQAAVEAAAVPREAAQREFDQAKESFAAASSNYDAAAAAADEAQRVYDAVLNGGNAQQGNSNSSSTKPGVPTPTKTPAASKTPAKAQTKTTSNKTKSASNTKDNAANQEPTEATEEETAEPTQAAMPTTTTTLVKKQNTGIDPLIIGIVAGVVAIAAAAAVTIAVRRSRRMKNQEQE